jgi:hypothetical protein
MTASADLVEFDDSGQPMAVYDAKYKPWGQTPSASDLYQVITYANRLGVSRAFLLYPGQGEHNEVIVGPCRVAMLGVPVLSTPPEPGGAPDTSTGVPTSAGNSLLPIWATVT